MPLTDLKSIRKVSLLVVVCTALLAFFGVMLYRECMLLGLAFVVVVVIGMYYGLVELLRRLVQNKFRSIYEIMQSRDMASQAILKGEKVSKNVSDDVLHWAEHNADEISRLEANEHYRKEFLGDVSHEIKTPLFAVQGYVLTLLDGAIDDPKINRKYLERSELSIDRLINIVNDLEAITKLESGELRLQYDMFDIVDLCQEITEAFYIEAQKKTITVSFLERGAQDMLMVYGDRRRIGQVVSNLIMNAIRYGKEGGFVKVTVDDLEDKVLVEVSDNGVGITPEHQSRIFDRFYRVDRSRSRASGGTGLGLSIVKHILEAHNETMSVRSRPGEGSVFAFTLGKEKF